MFYCFFCDHSLFACAINSYKPDKRHSSSDDDDDDIRIKHNSRNSHKPGREIQKIANQIDIPIDILVIGLGMALSFGALALLYIVAKESEGVDEEAYFYNASSKGIDPYQLHLELGRLAVKDGQVMIVQGIHFQ